MTRVLMYCSLFNPIIGGAERQAERLAGVLVRMGVEVVILTPKLRDDSPLEEEIGGVRVLRFPLVDLATRIPMRIKGIGLPNTLLRRSQIRRAVARVVDDFDLLHIHLAAAESCFAMEGAQARGKPTLCKVACGGPGFDFIKMKGRSVLAPLFVGRLVDRMTAWIAISEEIRADLEGAGVPPARIFGVPNGIEPVPQPAAREARVPRHFLYLGRLRKCDVDTLVAGFALHLASFPDSRLRIAGGGDAAPAREALSRHPDAAARIELTGPVDAGEAREWADVLVHPTRAEGVSNALLEAMSSGLPCLASDIPPNRELLDGGRAGLLFELGRPESLHACLDRISRDPELGPQLALNARKRIDDKYDLRVVATEYVSIYERILEMGEGGVRA